MHIIILPWQSSAQELKMQLKALSHFASVAAAAMDDDAFVAGATASMLRKGQPLICWGTALLRPKSITQLHIRLPSANESLRDLAAIYALHFVHAALSQRARF